MDRKIVAKVLEEFLKSIKSLTKYRKPILKESMYNEWFYFFQPGGRFMNGVIMEQLY